MKAAVFLGKHQLEVKEIETPKAGVGQVVLQVKACGICGTDLHIFEGDEGAAPTPSGTVLGHEFAGVITEVGQGVAGLEVGDRVCVDPNKLCDTCAYCKGGLGHFCTHMTGIGTTVDGGFAEYCVVPASQVYPIGDQTGFEQAAMTEPVSCCLHGIDMCDIACGDTVLVIGGGMIGLLMLQLAKLKGAAKIILSEPVEQKRQLAKKLGADLCIDPIHENIAKVLEANGITRIQTVIECVGRPQTMEQAISLAGNKSTVMFFGLTKPAEEIRVKPFELFKKEIVLKASYINPYTMKRALDLIDAGKIDVTSMIYELAPLEQLPAILADPARRNLGKFIIRP